MFFLVIVIVVVVEVFCSTTIIMKLTRVRTGKLSKEANVIKDIWLRDTIKKFFFTIIINVQDIQDREMSLRYVPLLTTTIKRWDF